jgi:hypothetical protein
MHTLGQVLAEARLRIVEISAHMMELGCYLKKLFGSGSGASRPY